LITSAGVSGGFEMGLHLLARLRSRALAKSQQLFAEYDPQPPFGGIDWERVERGDFDPERLPVRQPGEAGQFAFVLYAGLTPLDLAGPLGVFAALARIAPEYQLSVVAERIAPVEADNHLKLVPDKTFAEMAHPRGIVVPGGGEPTLRAMLDESIRAYVLTAADTADYVGSVCTGALILAGTGLLQGRPATTHWAFYRILEALGSPYVRQRWVDNGKIINSAGVSAGIDMALFWVSKLTDEETARRVQLDIQYDPRPPFGRIDWNHLDAMARLTRGVMSLRAPIIARRAKRLIHETAG
jgi:transcriptional regulator GlxA family with amidase domain